MVDAVGTSELYATNQCTERATIFALAQLLGLRTRSGAESSTYI
jgi:hypothetical protein